MAKMSKSPRPDVPLSLQSVENYLKCSFGYLAPSETWSYRDSPSLPVVAPLPCRSLRPARLLSLPRILHRADQEPAHAPRLCARGDGILRLACGEGRHAARGDRERARRDLHRGAAARAIRADREAAPGRVASPVRLDGDRPDHADQSGRRRARAAPHRAARQDAGARSRPRRASSSTRSTRRPSLACATAP